MKIKRKLIQVQLRKLRNGSLKAENELVCFLILQSLQMSYPDGMLDGSARITISFQLLFNYIFDRLSPTCFSEAFLNCKKVWVSEILFRHSTLVYVLDK